MKYVDSGSGKIPLVSLLAILSISLTVNLPGLAISPIMGKLNEVFSHVSELEIQLLTVLPNIVTIPFILCSGKICTIRNQIWVLAAGLILYTVTGILYFFATNMVELIVLSCLLGVGCGLVIPLAASLISQHCSGAVRTRELGMKSCLSNFSVIFATIFVGWIAAFNWHYAFFVYLVPLLPLALLPFMTNGYIARHKITDTAEAEASKKIDALKVSKAPVLTGRNAIFALAGLMAVYLIATYGTEIVAYYLPFTMEHYKLSTSDVGVATAMYYAAASISGFLLTRIMDVFRRYTMHTAIAICVVGLLLGGMLHSYVAYIVAIFIMGFGYGIIQPAIYDKTAAVAPSAEKSTAYFSYLLICNYIGISIVPFVISTMKRVFEAESDINFSFIFNAGVMAVMLIVAFVKRHSLVFSGTQSK